MTATTAPIADAAQADAGGGQAALALLLLIAIVVGWIAVQTLVRTLRAGKAHSVTGGRFHDYVLEALVNAAKLDGRVNDQERAAIAKAMGEATGAAIDPAVVENAFAHAKLNKDELVAYLAARAARFSQDQKVALLKALLAIFVADGRFDEAEHAALVDYTAAVGFDRQSAPDMLRGLAGSVTRGNII